ncbi:MAG: hypothetical protein PCFJNLEI_00773 [Verrucomicrobiae bacterium]|nr:hypothetical protein [Verrucomicrobiae bacterium]
MRQIFFIWLVWVGIAGAQTARLYTAPDRSAPGGVVGQLPGGEFTHVLAVDQDRKKVFRGTGGNGAGSFRIEHLPVGKYDVVLVTNERRVYEGLRLGNDGEVLSTELRANLEKRIGLADSFFNRYKIHRWAVDGERVLVLVERLRDKTILKGSGEKLQSNLRRLEVIELEQATDDWQMIQSRHLYREEEPIRAAPPFMRHEFVAGLSSIRVVDSVKDLGTVTVPKE